VQASEALSKSESLPTIIATRATKLSYPDYSKNSIDLRKKGKLLITREYNDNLCFITQHDHARVSLDIFLLFSEEIISGVKNKEELQYAIRNHDCGWIEYDKTPKVSENNEVYTFQNMKQSLQEELWVKSVSNSIVTYSSLLIAEHFKVLYAKSISRRNATNNSFNERCDYNVGSAFLKEKKPSVKTDEFKIELRFLQICDLLSLVLCRERPIDSRIISGIKSDQEKLGDFNFKKIENSIYKLQTGILKSKENLIEIPYKMIDRELLSRPKKLKEEFKSAKMKFRQLYLIS